MSDDQRGRRSGWQARGRRVLAPVVDAYGMYRGTAILLLVTASLALAAVLPVLHLLSTGSARSITRLEVLTRHNPGLGLPWKEIPVAPGDTAQFTVDFFFRLLLASGVATLAIATLSLFILFIARAQAREGEVSVRRAVGASRRSLVAAATIEGLGIAALALAAGGSIGLVISRWADGGWPGLIRSGSLAPLVFTAALMAGILLAGALFPVVFARRDRIAEAEMKPLALFGPATVQLGLSLIALTAGVLLARQAASASLTAHAEAPAGRVFEVDTGITNPRERGEAYASLLKTLARQPDLGTVSLTSPGALVGLGTIAHVTADCGQTCFPVRWRIIRAVHQFVSADSFRALGVHLLAGRVLTVEDRTGSTPVAVVNRFLAQHNFPFGEAVGRQLQVGDDAEEWYTVVGVVEDPPSTGLGATTQPPSTVYLSILQHPAKSVELLVGDGASPGATSTVLEVLRSVPGTRITASLSAADLIAAEAAPLGWFGRWLGFEGWIMSALAALGIFALLRIWVVSFYPEYGMRRAVGARRRDILFLILCQGMTVGLGGIALGLWFGPSVWTTLADIVPGLPAWDVLLLARFGAVLVGVALAGALGPAWAAARRTPQALIGATGE